jgi:4'-phosphopantetheinyl transferase
VTKQIATHQSGVVPVWLPQLTTLPLRANDIHVWLASLEIGQEQYHILSETLSDKEMERACRFRFEKDRIRFITTRGILRALLAGYLNMDAGKVSFVYGPYGKPELSAEAYSIPIHFNLSHSHGLALFAFALNCDIGVDIEFMQRDIAIDDIAGRFFSPNEKAALDKLPSNMKKKGFFACWARKEALLKATGKGLSFGLERVEVSVHPELRASVLRIGGSEKEASLWSLHDLSALPGYTAALAVKGHGFNLCLQKWTATGIPNRCIRKPTP